jgi:hypothetical protein
MRRLAVGFVVVAMLATLAWAAPAQADASRAGGTYLDDNGNVHEGMIEALAEQNTVAGCNAAGTLVCPGDFLTRGQMASVISRALDLPAATQDHFADDQGSVHEDHINRLAEAEITTGCNNEGSRFCPQAPVRRDQLAAFLANARDLPAKTDGPFTDIGGNVHARWINAVAHAGITTGCASNRFCPGDVVRRDQAASFVGRAIEATALTPPPLRNDSPAADWCGVARDWARTLSPEDHDTLVDYEFWAIGLKRPDRFPGGLLQAYTVSPFSGDPVAATWFRVQGLELDRAEEPDDVEWTYPVSIQWDGDSWVCES